MLTRSLLASTALLATLALPAAAADLAVKAPPMTPVAAVYNWSGFYIGAHVGYGRAEIDSTVVTPSGSFPAGFGFNTSEPSGLIAGGQIGYNWQTGALVLGVELDGSWADLDDTVRTNSPVNTNYVEQQRNIDWLFSAAGRLGFAVNNWFLYGKAGWAWANFESHAETRNAGNTVLAVVTGSGRRDGWLAGAGAEIGLSPNWSIKFEYNFIDFGTDRVTNTSTGTPTLLERDVDAQMHIFKGGINYRFGGPTPVVARY